MKRLLLFLAISSMMPFASGQTNSVPLDETEKRHVLDLLNELGRCRDSLTGSTTLYDLYLQRETEQDGREKATYERAVEVEKRATALAQKERDLAGEKAAFYEAAFRSLTKKPGIGCRILAALTLGIHRCN